jgi:hypothetical protein
VFVIFSAIVFLSLFSPPLMRVPARAGRVELDGNLGQIPTRAFRDPSCTLIFLGFFSCGYQIGFVTAHFAAVVAEMCGPIATGGVLHVSGVTTTSALGAVAISLIGLVNIAGALTAGWAGKRYSKKHLLAGINAARTEVADIFDYIFGRDRGLCGLQGIARLSSEACVIPQKTGLPSSGFSCDIMPDRVSI